MKWMNRRQSSNVEDLRRIKGGGKLALGGGLIGIIVLLITMFGGENAQQYANMAQQLGGNQAPQTQGTTEERELTQEEIELGDYVSTIFADCEDIWMRIFKENNRTYELPKMVLFYDGVSTACGDATSDVGPFYCPGDKKVYMDLRFFEELKTKYGAKGGDFAIAYVTAHEVGHHIQTMLGTSQQVRNMQASVSEKEANRLSVCQELQADFYAGVWAHHVKKYMEIGDIDEALSAAQAVGDDAIQKRMQGKVVPDSFTHGTSEQRKKWFKLGFEKGDVSYGNTFAEAGYKISSF
jgi:predicted metalloprotease